MKIAYLPGLFPMLSETPVLNQITGLVKRGHEVDIFGDRPREPSPYHPSVDEYHLLSRSYYRPDLPSGTVGRWAKGMRLFAESGKDDRRVLRRAMNVFRFGTRAATGRLVLQTAQFLPPRSYDIIQAGFGEQGLKALRMQRLGAIRGKLITAFRGADLTRYLGTRGPSVYRRLFQRGDLFLPVSEAFAGRLKALGCPSDRVAVHRTGIDLSLFRFQPGAPRRDLRLVSVGRLVEKKGLDDALRAIALLGAEGFTVSYTIIGDGPLRVRLEEAARGLGIERVTFAGPELQASVIERLRESDVLLAPSVKARNGDEEGIPNVIKEAMAMGLPVVSTRHSGIPELVEHGVTGLLAGEHDPNGLAACLEHLAEHPEVWPAIQDTARRKVEQEYDIERLNDRLIERYQAILR
jgi:colanic acid/amylovoran biosynthesis glycosyltransferase